MPSRVLETVLTGRNLLSPVLTGAARDVEAYDGKVTAANARAGESASASAKVQETAAAKVTAANARTAESSSASSAKVVSANVRASESSRAFADVTESSVARAGLAWGSLATKALPLVAVATALITGKMAGDYQQLITKLQTTAGESQRNLGAVSKGMLDMAGQVGVSADELAKGMYTVDSAGIHGADSLKVLKAAAQGARQEQADLGHVVDAVTTSLHDYHLPASDAAKVTSELIAAVSHGKTTFDELTGSMHSIEPVAAGAGMTIAQTAGALAAMTASGMHADQAAQNLAHTIGSFENATKPMRDELFQIGLDATDLQTHLGERGIAGTLQMVSDAIVHKMGPAGQIALTALQTNKTAVQGLSTMIGAMPPQLADLAAGLLAGTTGQKEFRTAALDLGGTAGALADQFLAAYKSNDGFSASLKSGGPQVQTYIGALAKAVGTADGLRTALMLTGENAGTTNDAIAAVGRASADAKGNIAGWSEVQGNFNQKLAQAGAEAKSLAIEAGQHMLPVLTNVVGWIGSTALPGIQHLAGGVGDAVKAFMGIPAPIRDAVLALVALKAITSTDMFAGLLASGRVVAVGFAHDMSSMVASARAGAGSITAAFAEAKAAQQALTIEQFGTSAVSKATGDIAGLGAAAGVAAKGGLSAMRSGIGGLVGMLGGPWVVGIAAAVAGLVALKNAADQHDASVRRATQDVQKWSEAVALGPGGMGHAAIDAQKHLDDLGHQADTLHTQMENVTAAAERAPSRFSGAAAAASGLGQKYADLRTELANGKAAWDAQYAAMTPMAVAQARVAQATNDLNWALKNNPPGSLAVTTASDRLSQAQSNLAYQTGLVNDASKTELQRMQDLANAQLGAVSSSLAAKQSYDVFLETLKQYQSTTQHSAVETDGLAQAAISSAASAGQAGSAWAKANNVSDAAAASNYAQLLSLQQVANAMGKDTPTAVTQQIDALKRAVAQGHLTAGQMDDITRSINGIPKDPSIKVSADVQAAKDQIDGLLRNYQHVQYTGSAIIVNGRVIANADGNLLPMSATSASVVRPGALRVIGDNPVSDEAFIPINNSTRSMSILGETASRMGMGLVPMANGGFWNMGETFPARPSQGWLSSIDSTLLAQIRAFVPAYNPSAGVEQWRGLVDQVLRQLGVSTSADNGVLNMIAKESGGNPRAINLWDSNAAAGHPSQGLMQTIPGTFYAYAGPYAGRGITDPLANIYAGVNYALHNYGFGMLASGGRKNAFGGYMGYRTGTDYVPADGLAYLHKGEAVVPADQNPRQSAASMPGYGTPFSGAMFGPTGPMHVTAQVRVFVGDREITDIARVEATAVVDRELGQLADTVHYSTGH